METLRSSPRIKTQKRREGMPRAADWLEKTGRPTPPIAQRRRCIRNCNEEEPTVKNVSSPTVSTLYSLS